MATRDKVIEIIRDMSQLEVEYTHLLQATGRAPGDELEDALDALAEISERVSVSTDATQLVRDERVWLAGRVP